MKMVLTNKRNSRTHMNHQLFYLDV